MAAKLAGFSKSAFMEILGRYQVETPSDSSLVRALKIMVDDGEAEAIALASERGYRIILDDRIDAF